MNPPNLLFIFTDEQRADTMAAYGNARIQMPNLNRLAAESTGFRTRLRHPAGLHALALDPADRPLSAHQRLHREQRPPAGQTCPACPRCCRGRAYTPPPTTASGTWATRSSPSTASTSGVSIEDGYDALLQPGPRPRRPRSTYHHWLVEQGCRARRTARPSAAARRRACRSRIGKPAYLAEEASRFIREQPQTRPLCAVRQLPRAAHALLRAARRPVRPGRGAAAAQLRRPARRRAAAQDAPLSASLLRSTGTAACRCAPRPTGGGMIANYWGLCSLVDTHVGHDPATRWTACGLDENTIVVYTSDHGDMMGSHRLLAKCVMSRRRCACRCWCACRDSRRPAASAGPVSQIDLVPTLLESDGQPCPGRCRARACARCWEPAPPAGRRVRRVERAQQRFWRRNRRVKAPAGHAQPRRMPTSPPPDRRPRANRHRRRRLETQRVSPPRRSRIVRPERRPARSQPGRRPRPRRPHRRPDRPPPAPGRCGLATQIEL